MPKQKASDFVGPGRILLKIAERVANGVIDAGGTDADVRRLHDDDVLIAEISQLVVSKRQVPTQSEFTITVKKDEHFNSLVMAAEYDGINDDVTVMRFPMRYSQPGERKLVLLHFDRTISSEDALKEAQRLGLERPTYEDCLRFGAQHPQVRQKFSISFLHEPILGNDRNQRVLCLYQDGSKAMLSFFWFSEVWKRTYRFAFVRKQ